MTAVADSCAEDSLCTIPAESFTPTSHRDQALGIDRTGCAPLSTATSFHRGLPVREEFDKFFRRPTTATVHVGVYPLGSVDNRHTKGRKDFQITDFDNDGRYVSFGSRTVIVKPTDRQRVTATLREMIGRTVEEVRNGDHFAR
ncbi:hypothetical protein [Nocardia pseudovaccinii]|uniref:hypothetical protein n=1 Tax=Nocardia pseudovaccinii TaxID=189540 RepID=UPI0007A53B9E|nr:hypothetical protein [Nocardia pseudovaccinii]